MPTNESYITATQTHPIGKANRPVFCHLPNMSSQTTTSFPKSYEEGIDRWDDPLWPVQNHTGLEKGETEILPHDYKVVNPHVNEIKSYEQGIDRRDGLLWLSQDRAGLRKGETEVSPHDYVVASSSISPSSSSQQFTPSSLEEGIDRWDGPLWPGQDHAGLRQGETEVLPKRYRVVNGVRLVPLNEKERPKVEDEIVGYEDGVDRWDGPLWLGQDHAGLREGETEVLPEIYHVTPGLKL